MRIGTDVRVVTLDERSAMVFLAGNHRAFVVDIDLAERLAQRGLAALSQEEAAEWHELERLGLVSDVNRDVLRRSTFADGADLAINVNLTHACNLACTYCFADGGDYGRITQPMTSESVAHIFEFIDQNITSSHAVRFEFFGGEPLANPAIIEEICERSEEMAARTGIRFLYRISTNLTLLPPVALKRFAEHRFVVSISLDGGANVQDRYRPTLGGRGSYERIIRNARRVRDAGSDIIMVARMTVASSTPSLVDRVRDLWELNLFDYFQIYPAVYRESGVALPSGGCSSAAGEGRVINFMLQAEMPQQFREFLLEYPSFFTPENRFRGVLEYERTAEMLLDGKLALAFCSGGRKYFTHSPNGAVSPCHRLVGDERFDVGTGAEGIVKPLDEWRTSVDDHPVCSGCWARYVCGGGCKQENHLSTGDVNRLNPESCAYQLLLAEEVLKAVALAPADYRARPRQLDDVFVSCGRPVSANGRVPDPPAGAMEALRFFRPVVRESL